MDKARISTLVAETERELRHALQALMMVQAHMRDGEYDEAAQAASDVSDHADQAKRRSYHVVMEIRPRELPPPHKRKKGVR